MNDSDRDKVHQRAARKLHGQDGLSVTVEGLELLRKEALRGKDFRGRKRAADTYKALTGVKP